MKTPRSVHRKERERFDRLMVEKRVMFPHSRMAQLWAVWIDPDAPKEIAWREIKRERGRELVQEDEFIEQLRRYWK